MLVIDITWTSLVIDFPGPNWILTIEEVINHPSDC